MSRVSHIFIPRRRARFLCDRIPRSLPGQHFESSSQTGTSSVAHIEPHTRVFLSAFYGLNARSECRSSRSGPWQSRAERFPLLVDTLRRKTTVSFVFRKANTTTAGMSCASKVFAQNIERKTQDNGKKNAHLIQFSFFKCEEKNAHNWIHLNIIIALNIRATAQITRVDKSRLLIAAWSNFDIARKIVITQSSRYRVFNAANANRSPQSQRKCRKYPRDARGR